ncbi:MAG TPA: hypothetical protein VN622_12905 [Clostridia bacterium]|nr:hypothetical protein [Clostridia bacterium]
MYAFTFEFNPFRDLSTIHYFVIFLILVATWIARELKERAGQSWPVVYGTVEFAEFVTVDGKMRAEVRYSYSVNNEYFSGVFFRFPRSEKSASIEHPRDCVGNVHSIKASGGGRWQREVSRFPTSC